MHPAIVARATSIDVVTASGTSVDKLVSTIT